VAVVGATWVIISQISRILALDENRAASSAASDGPGDASRKDEALSVNDRGTENR
jgi:hypothetical protein